MKKIIHIDMDGTLCDFETPISNRLGYSISSINDSKKRKLLIDSIISKDKRFYLYLKPIKDAIDSFKYLSFHYDTYILSTPDWSIPQSYMDKRLWIEMFLGERAKKKLILSHRKDLLIGDFLIDDRTENGQNKFKGILIKFGSKQYPNWETIVEYFERYVNPNKYD